MDKIREMDLQDFYAHLRICMAREAIKNEFQAMLAGAGPSGEEENISTQPRVISSRKLPSGATVETTREKSIKFNSTVKPVRINKEGEYVGDA